MPKCYMCPSPKIEQVRAEGEKDYSFRKWLSDTDVRECHDARIARGAPLDRSLPSALNVLQGLAPKLEAITKITNEETTVFSKVMIGLKEFVTDLKDAIECDYNEAMIKWPNFVRRAVKDSTDDGVEHKNRFAVMMSRKQITMAIKSLNIQMGFMKVQYQDLITARKKLTAALDERRSLLKTFPEITESMCAYSHPEKFCINPDRASPQSKALSDTRSIPAMLGKSQENLEASTPPSRKADSCKKECNLRLSVHHCYEAIREVKETIKMALYRRRKSSEVVHQTFYTYADRKKYKASPIQHGTFYGVGCNGTGGLRMRDLKIS